MALEYQKLIAENPNYDKTVHTLPKKMFSGKTHKKYAGYFFCYELPTQKSDGKWSNGDGLCRWYLYDVKSNKIVEQTYEIWHEIQCTKDEKRVFDGDVETFRQSKKIVDCYINKGYMRSVQAPIGIKPHLVAWLGLR